MSMLPTTKTSKNPQLDSGCITRGDQVCLEGVQDGLPDGDLGGNDSPSVGWLHGMGKMVRLHIIYYSYTHNNITACICYIHHQIYHDK